MSAATSKSWPPRHTQTPPRWPPTWRAFWILRPRWWWIIPGAAMLLMGEVVGLNALLDAELVQPTYEYRLVTPQDAMRMVNEEGWRVSERIRMTDSAVYLYRRTDAPGTDAR